MSKLIVAYVCSFCGAGITWVAFKGHAYEVLPFSILVMMTPYFVKKIDKGVGNG
jgi:hypothetical protein